MEMERERVLINPYDDLRKCKFCDKWIEENNGKRIIICNKILYYHPLCLDKLFQRMEILNYLYS
jgi:hypothetical protein